ncbi:GNAT family N-acetyltransferase [Aurantiacibacter aquimixticola]|uniref:GNAT family N-acetyltransferase n=1 Tax=Aurantiacibacter aquimixticola TaxID=1958945 RepID=A0A419RS51_9SPHN|nr:GNAT family N-acetyltransferase [Aurantiacibacter aquimixticola]RJY08610.1 GNAT family N-acetyltransferase [Aurantiacibacter aquimixticola]
MTAVSYHDTIKDLQDLAWRDGGPFARPAWFVMLEEMVGAPLFAVAKDGDEAICLPLMRGEAGWEALTNWYAFTWQPLRTHNAHDQLLTALAEEMPTKTDRIVLDKLTREDAAHLKRAFRGTGWSSFAEVADTNHILQVQGRPFAAYLAERPGALRTALSRKTKKLDTVMTNEFSNADWSIFEDVYADSWKPAEGNADLLRRFARQESAAGRLRFAIARHDGAPVAAQFWTVDNGTAFIHKLAHRRGAQALSPGTILTAALMEHIIDTDGVATVDFGTGDEPYKRDWMEQVRLRYRLTCLRRDKPRNWPLLLKSRVKAMRGKLVSFADAG